MADLLYARLIASLRDHALKELREYETTLDAERRLYSRDEGYLIPIPRERFEAMLRETAVVASPRRPPAPGARGYSPPTAGLVTGPESS